MKKKTLLITAAGGAGPIAIMKSLKDKYRIVATDMNKYAAGIYIADKGYVSPAVNSTTYRSFMEKLFNGEQIDFIVPSIDEELIEVSNLAKIHNIKVVLPNVNFIKFCLDKLVLMKRLHEEKISCPETELLSDLIEKDINFPCVVKPRVGRGSRGFAILSNSKELEGYLINCSYNKQELLIQEFIEGREFTVSVLVSKNGKILSVIPKEIIKKEGITHIAVTRKNKDIENLAVRIQETFLTNGPYNIQLIISKKTDLATIFEINPRLSTTVALDIAAGVNAVDLIISDHLGISVKKQQFKEDLLMTRYFEGYYIDGGEVK